jgi:CheY-like chemotaxis protein
MPSQLILVVEDYDEVRRLVRGILAEDGYRVIAVGDGAAAVLESERHAGAIDLILTDIVLPDVSGRDLATRITATNPRASFLYMSGRPADELLDLGVVADAHFLKKPFSSSELLHAVKRLIGSPL